MEGWCVVLGSVLTSSATIALGCCNEQAESRGYDVLKRVASLVRCSLLQRCDASRMRRSLAMDVIVRSSGDTDKHSQYRSLSLNIILPLLGSLVVVVVGGREEVVCSCRPRSNRLKQREALAPD